MAKFKALNRACWSRSSARAAFRHLIPTEIDGDGAVARDLFRGMILTGAVDSLEAGKHDGEIEARYRPTSQIGSLIQYEVQADT